MNEDLKQQGKEIAAAIFGVPVENIKDATGEEPIFSELLKADAKMIREQLDKKILDELYKTV